jgi:hypothetical protein
MMDAAEKRGQIIKHLEEGLALAEEIEDGDGATDATMIARPLASIAIDSRYDLSASKRWHERMPE